MSTVENFGPVWLRLPLLFLIVVAAAALVVGVVPTQFESDVAQAVTVIAVVWLAAAVAKTLAQINERLQRIEQMLSGEEPDDRG